MKEIKTERALKLLFVAFLNRITVLTYPGNTPAKDLVFKGLHVKLKM